MTNPGTVRLGGGVGVMSGLVWVSGFIAGCGLRCVEPCALASRR